MGLSSTRLAVDLGMTEGEHPLVADKVRPYFNHPGFPCRRTSTRSSGVREDQRPGRAPRVRHALHPDDDGGASTRERRAYSAQHLDVARDRRRRRRALTAQSSGTHASRSSPPSQPADVANSPRGAAQAGRAVRRAVAHQVHLRPHGGRVRPRTGALETAQEEPASPPCGPAPSAPREQFVRGLVDLVLERAALARALDARAPAPVGTAVGGLPALSATASAAPAAAASAGVDSHPAACSTDPGPDTPPPEGRPT